MNNTNKANCRSNNNAFQIIDTRKKFISLHPSYTLTDALLNTYKMSRDLVLTLKLFIDKDCTSIPPITTNQQFADLLHCTRITIFRHKKKLRDMGLIDWSVDAGYCSRIKINYSKMHEDISAAKMRILNNIPTYRASSKKLLIYESSIDHDATIKNHLPNLNSEPNGNLNETFTSPKSSEDVSQMIHEKPEDVSQMIQPMYHQRYIESDDNLIKSDTYDLLNNKKIIRNIYIAQNDQKAEIDETSRQDVRVDTTSDIIEDRKPELTKQDQPIKRPAAKTKLSFDFEAAYKLYPRHVGKTKGIAKCVRDIKTQKDYDDLITAINNFREAFSSREVRFIKQFDTFMSSWRDYVNKGDFDDDSGASAIENNLLIDLFGFEHSDNNNN